jgi:hypothetical protein
MAAYFDPPASCDIAVLPNAQVKTSNGVPVEADMEIYYCYAPTRALAYRVISDTAYKLKNSPWYVWVITDKGHTQALNPMESTTDLSEWLEFYKKRHNDRLPELPYGFSDKDDSKNRKDDTDLNESKTTTKRTD